MANLKEIRNRISSVESTMQITSAMKMVAAAKLRRAQENAEKGRPFSEKMNDIILNLSNSITDKDSASKFLVGTGKNSVHLCVVITADRGLCGGFNTNICRKAKTYFEKILKIVQIHPPPPVLTPISPRLGAMYTWFHPQDIHPSIRVNTRCVPRPGPEKG